MAAKKDNRKKSVVNPRVQWTLALRVVLHFFVFVCAGTVFGMMNQFLANPLDGVAASMETFIRNSAPILVALFCLMPIFVRDTLTLSNRIAGPIYNMRNTMNRITEGEPDVPPLKFRKKDMWNGLAGDFNNMVDSLRATQTVQIAQETASASVNTDRKEREPELASV